MDRCELVKLSIKQVVDIAQYCQSKNRFVFSNGQLDCMINMLYDRLVWGFWKSRRVIKGCQLVRGESLLLFVY